MNKFITTLTLLYLFKSNYSSKLGNAEFAKNNQKLVIDHDGGADDALALFLSILYEKHLHGPIIVGLTTVNGNAIEPKVFKNTQRILDIAGRKDIPIYRGTEYALVENLESDHYFGIDGLGDNENVNFEEIKAKDGHAAIALIELSKQFPGELIVMAIGPMTNIALASRLDPEFINRLSHLYVGAGHIHSNHTPKPEFNALMDVEAYRVVVEVANKDKVTIIPFSQVMISLNISKAWRTDVFGAIPTKIIQAQNSFERISLPKDNTWSLLDSTVAAIVLDGNIVDEVKFSKNSITLCGTERGLNTNNFDSPEPNSRIIYSVKEEYYKDLLVNVFSKDIQA